MVTGRQQAVWPDVGVARVQKVHRRAAEAALIKVYGRGYRLVQPMALWRIFRREILPELDLGQVRRVVVAGPSGVAIAWRLAKTDLTLEVTTGPRRPRLPPQQRVTWAGAQRARQRHLTAAVPRPGTARR